MIALGIVFLCVLAALAVVVLSEQMLFFPRFFAYLALYAVSYPLYLANDARWYWFTLATDVTLLLATNEAVNLRLRGAGRSGRAGEGCAKSSAARHALRDHQSGA